ncbi:D-alanyl-D-alanine carboxypeptidase family protein [Alsobacter sp. KACC 23698]|uniref:D-alanyl-D-alanine carboxypeptidase family protein n=1 Tax=Alsobacter sp. KACC 23698 TaxID=3149229 RepID=A0AAU7JL57_9HYPH
MACFAAKARTNAGVTRLWVAALVSVVAIAGTGPAEAGKRRMHPGKSALHKAGAYQPPYAAIVVDPQSGRILHAVDADAPRHPASLTKVMTLYLLFEKLQSGEYRLDTPLQVSAAAMNQAPSRLGVKKGETITVEDAIKAIVTRSANDVAVVVAENIGGTEAEFARKMTEKAASLGMRNTTFVNASGLPNKAQITTARDLSILGQKVREQFPSLFTYFATRSFDYAGTKVLSHNRLMTRLEGMDGIKTGFTNASGFNLLASVRRDDRSLVAVILGGASQRTRDNAMAELVNRYIAEAAPAAPVAVASATPAGSAATTPSVAQAPAPAQPAAAQEDPIVTGSIRAVSVASVGSLDASASSLGLPLTLGAFAMAAAGLALARRRVRIIGDGFLAASLVCEHIAEQLPRPSLGAARLASANWRKPRFLLPRKVAVPPSLMDLSVDPALAYDPAPAAFAGYEDQRPAPRSAARDAGVRARPLA